MGNRLDLNTELLAICPNVYFQPPSNITLKYPCVVYNKSDKLRSYGSDVVHVSNQGYKIMVIDRDPDSNIPELLESSFQYCGVDQYYTLNNLNHTIISLYY